MRTQTNKQALALVIIAVVVVILAIVYIIVSRAPSNASGDSGTQTSKPLFEAMLSDIASVDVNNLDDSFSVVPDDQDSWTVKGFEKLPFSKGSLTNLLTTANSIYAEREVEKGPSELSNYGLDNPMATMKVTLKDGKSFELLVGIRTVTGDGWYAKTSDSDAVYTVDKSVGDRLQLGKTEYIDTAIGPKMDSESSVNLGDVTIGGKESEGFVLVRNETDDPTHSIGEPVQGELEKEGFDYIYLSLSSLRAEKAVSLDVSDENLARYGLIDPDFTLEFEYEGVKYSYKFGSPDGVQYFGICGDRPVIYSVLWDFIEFLDLSLDDILQKAA
jgi:hypothetical protein